ncbi:hypothetical protein UFOVP9_39 [uncultured Caudovirales phage]|jgi:archaellum component FlaC|uniref:Uncharacterized protein n=1 Tax=uncultured Caudovirales phage TaxID=2100421 RepID=A0A6J5KM09_9CAUD|nr:hypothetical protein UFOVP9_39 [uncultured Caudovirales phage]
MSWFNVYSYQVEINNLRKDLKRWEEQFNLVSKDFDIQKKQYQNHISLLKTSVEGRDSTIRYLKEKLDTIDSEKDEIIRNLKQEKSKLLDALIDMKKLFLER